MRVTSLLGCVGILACVGLVWACGASDDSSMSSSYVPSSAQGGSTVGPPQGGSAGAAGTQQNPPDAGAPSCEGLSEGVPRDFYLSADDSNSMASPAIARRLIQTGAQVPASLIRVYEFLNYYNVLDEPAEPNGLRVVSQALAGASPGRVELQFLVQSEATPAARMPMTITLVLDTSGSMAGLPIQLTQSVIRAIAASLQAGDIISAVTWSVGQTVPLEGHVVEGPNDPAVLAVANGLAANGSTDLHSGLVRGYALAEQHYGADRINRVVLISDGQANVGVTDQNLIGERADDENKEGIYLVGVGTGDGVSDTLLNTVTDAGNGAYVYIDSDAEAYKMFGRRFAEVMMVAARNVQLKVTLPWYMQMSRFYGEQYSTVAGKVKPQHLAPGDAMVFQQEMAACGDTSIVGSDQVQWEAKWMEPVTHTARVVTGGASMEALLQGDTSHIRRGKAIVTYAEMLRSVPTLSIADRKLKLDAVAAAVAMARGEGSDEDLDEITALVDRYRAVMAP